MIQSKIPRVIFFFMFLFSCETIVFAQGKKEKNNCWFRSGYFHISRSFIEEMFSKYPTITLSSIGAAVGMGLYGKEISEFLHEERDKVCCATALSLVIAYLKKDAILDWLSEEDEEEDEVVTMSSGGDNSIQQFTKSLVRIFHPGEIKTTFKDVAGLETAKEDVMDIMLFLKDPQKFVEMGAKIPKGILLSGTPGNGKTLLARAVAGEVQCPFLYVNASEFVEAIVGVGAARIRNLFSVAKELSPCIIFIDELDAVGRKRSSHNFGGGDTENAQTITELLAAMDGFEQPTNPIVIIGATNRPEVLDDALLRPGRFDRKIEIPSPYLHDRHNILKIHFSKVKTDPTIDMYKIACGTRGFSGAELAHLVNEAAILAVREGKSCVTMNHVDQARDYILMGRETKGMHVDQLEYWQTAVHEAGHAITRVLQKDATPLYKVTVTPRGGALGLTWAMPEKESYSKFEQELRAEIVVALGGSVAEELIFKGRGVGAKNDLQQARHLATQMVMEFGMAEEFKDISFSEFIHNQVQLPDEIATKLQKAVAQIIHECRKEAQALLTSHEREVRLLADMLVEQGTVFGSDVYTLCNIEKPDIPYSLAV